MPLVPGYLVRQEADPREARLGSESWGVCGQWLSYEAYAFCPPT